MPNNDSHQHVVKTSEQWNDRIVEFWVVPRGCLCVELTPKGKTKIKIGEGNKYYSQLPYICEGHDLSQYYTKDEIDNLFDNLNRMAIMSTDEYDSKSDLPMNDNKLGDVRFVKSSSPSIKIDPDIYLWDGSKWVFVGYEFKDIDLSQYLKKDEFHEMFDPVKEQVDEMYPMRHTHENKDVLDQITAPYTIPEKEKLAGLENYDDTEIRQLIHDTGHTHPNKDILDTITSESLWSESDREKFDSLHNYDDSEVKVRIEILESKSHTHDNKDILDQITAPFTTEDKTKLDSLHNDDVFRGTDGMYPGSEGNVPAPSVLDVGKFLSSDGTWKSVESTNDGVLDITQEDPDNLNELTITYADGDTTTITIPTGDGEYYPGQGIEFTHPGSELYRVVEYIKKPKGVTVTTDVIPSGTTDFRCDIKYFSYIGRFTILAHNGERGSFCFSPPATNQSSASTRMWMYSAHEVWEDLYLTVSSYSADPVVAHLRWGYTMSISYDHISNTAQRTTDILPGTNNVGFNNECDTSYYWAKFYENDILVGDLVPVIRDSDNAYGFFNKITNVFSTADGDMSAGPETGEVITIGDPSEKYISAKLGTGLTFDDNDAIELDDTIKIQLNCNNEPD